MDFAVHRHNRPRSSLFTILVHGKMRTIAELAALYQLKSKANEPENGYRCRHRHARWMAPHAGTARGVSGELEQNSINFAGSSVMLLTSTITCEKFNNLDAKIGYGHGKRMA
ncbi:hypothetical protein CRG98_041998 [Punica granatum]|uniref:Uncharacterized protein n=1 Tax=Punica granatum TaxID=22663 RepID=A0A2I0I167_PUNGR|nr:hypothetical protein CRG98_041998 [Punica granatum]